MTLYAGNSLTGAIYKGNELICKTGGATADMIAVGNQLRRAEAYYRTEDVGGKYYAYYYDNRYGPYNSCPKIGFIYSIRYYIIEGKLYYTETSTNNLIRCGGTIGSKENFTFIKGNLFFDSDGNSYYCQSSGANPSFKQMTDLPKIYDENSSRIIVGDFIVRWLNYIIVDGALYLYNNAGTTRTLIDDSGIWTHLYKSDSYSGFGIRDGYVCYIKNSDIIQTTLRPYLSWTHYSYNYIYHTLASDKKTLICAQIDSTGKITTRWTKTRNYNIIKGVNDYHLDENGNLYDGSNTSTYATGVTALSSDAKVSYPAYIKDNKLYRQKTQVSFMSDLNLNNFGKSYFESVVQVENGYVREEVVYGTSNLTKVYSNPSLSISTNIDSKTSTTVTVNGIVYSRDQSKDSSFNFIPDDLKTKTFTDADLLDACLSAGLDLNG